MESKALSTNTSLKEMKLLRDLCGFVPQAPRLPQIKISYDETKAPLGTFYKTSYDFDKGENVITPLGETFKGVILVRSYRCSKWDGKNEKMEYSSSEFFNWDENVYLAHQDKLEEQLPYRDLKKTYGVSLRMVLYVYLEEDKQIYKLDLGGSALFPYNDYVNSLKGNVPLATTEFSTIPAKKGSIKYYKIAFSCVEMSDAVQDRTLLAKQAREAIEAQNLAFIDSICGEDYEKMEDDVIVSVEDIQPEPLPDFKPKKEKMTEPVTIPDDLPWESK